MKNLIKILAGVSLVALMCGALFLSSAIYETSNKATVETYFFQPDYSFDRRQSTPKALQDLSDDELRNMLLGKYLIEYFYVTPDVSDITRRMEKKGTLATMSSGKVFTDWLENIAPKIEEMAKNNMLRTVSLVSIEPQAGSDKYWRVEYELKTWTHPNDLAASPEVTRGVLFMEIEFRRRLREIYKKQGLAEQKLEEGGDPAPLFAFGIVDITTQEEE